MAQKVQVLLVCDLDENEVEGTQTVSFSLDGQAYEIDVCDKHGAQLRDAFATFVGAARRAGRPTSRRTAKGARAGADDRNATIRAWAKKNGQKVSERGRLSAVVIAAYDAAH